jgi:enoyl-CoA hydratase/carnithine racemase
MSDAELILLDIDGPVALLTLNRPEKRNALSRDLLVQFEAILDRLHESTVKVVIVTGAGDVSFCCGADLKDTSKERRRTYADFIPWIRVTRLIKEHPCVFIAAVNGYALGGGLTLVNNCDLAVASETATFGAPEITFGTYAGLAGPSTVRRIAPKHASELILRGKRFDAETAYRWGLVNYVVPADKLLERARELADEVAQWDATALDVARGAMRAEETLHWDEAINHGIRNGSIIPVMQETNETWRAEL